MRVMFICLSILFTLIFMGCHQGGYKKQPIDDFDNEPSHINLDINITNNIDTHHEGPITPPTNPPAFEQHVIEMCFYNINKVFLESEIIFEDGFSISIPRKKDIKVTKDTHKICMSVNSYSAITSIDFWLETSCGNKAENNILLCRSNYIGLRHIPDPTDINIKIQPTLII